MTFRPVKSETLAQSTMEGAGVHLYRAFGFHDPKALDPFLLFDDFRNDDPDFYREGFPWHPSPRNRRKLYEPKQIEDHDAQKTKTSPREWKPEIYLAAADAADPVQT